MLFLWIFVGFCFTIISRVDSQMGCSFSSDDPWCNYTNVYDGRNGPQWLRSKPPIQQSVERYIESRRSMKLHGTHPMECPPKADNYLYTGPTRSNNFVDNFAQLISPVLLVNETGKCLYFSYHNRIPIKLNPTLTVLKRNENNNSSSEGESKDELLAEFYSLESSKWFEAQVPLPVGEYRLIFSGKNYNNETVEGGVLAIASITITDGSCAETVAPWLKSPGDCGFEEDVELCGYSYTNDSTVKLVKILAESLSPVEQSQRIQRQVPTDRFMAMTSGFHEITNHGSRARLLSPEISIQREGCVYLWYYNSVQPKADDNNAFNIIQLQPTSEKLLFRLPTPKTNRDKWYQLNGALPRGTYRLILDVLYKNDFAENDYVSFDNIEIFNKSCSDVMSRGGACSSGSNLCRNGGSCLESGKKSYRCTCRDGYFGNRCEHEYLCNAPSVNPCRNGGTCFPDGRLDIRCFCQPGYDGKLCTEIRRCGSPEKSLVNARVVSFTNETYGSTARFECTTGWIQLGDLVGTCNAQGSWEIQGVCLSSSCGNPPKYRQLTLVSVTNITYRGQARYRCQDGFTMYENQDFLTCHVDVDNYQHNWRSYRNLKKIQGQWNAMHGLNCHSIPNCGQPRAVANANVNVTSVLMNGVATYRCNRGYELNIDQSSINFTCSQNGQWTNKREIQAIQCLMVADCGPPPKVSHAVVSYTKTSINGTAVYKCETGYRLIGSDTAVCWAIGTNRLEKWIEWLFVPKCEPVCAVKVGRHGNTTVAKFQISVCELSVFETFSPRLHCGPAVPYLVKRKEQSSDGTNEKIVFYGNDFCISEKVEKVKLYHDDVLYRSTKCQSFCFQYPFEIRDIVIYDELRYTQSIQGCSYMPSTCAERRIYGPIVYKTSRNKTIIRYTSP